jgi:hypothetical protein
LSLLTDTPVPVRHDFLASFQKAHEAAGLDYVAAFDAYHEYGYVFKGPEYLMLGCADTTRSDAWLVYWAEMHPRPSHPLAAVALFLKLMPSHRPFIGWARCLKGRHQVVYYSTDRLLHLTSRLR